MLARVCIPTSIHDDEIELCICSPLPPYLHLNSAKNEMKKRRARPSSDTMTLIPAQKINRAVSRIKKSAFPSLSPFTASCFFDIISVHYRDVYEFHDNHHIIKSVSIGYTCEKKR